MFRKVAIASITLVAIVTMAVFHPWSASPVQAQRMPMPNSLCYTGDCRAFNWAGHTPLDQYSNPLPPGATCNIGLNQTVWICASDPSNTCNSTGLVPTCRGWFLDALGNVQDCWYWAYNC